MKRSLIDYIIISLKGMAMGAADIVPGVSGGTIAFISGIYEELIESLNNINSSAFKDLISKGIKHTWRKLNGSFMLALTSGVLISLFSLAKGIKWLIKYHHILLWAFFFGLVTASIIYISKQIKASLWSLDGLKIFLAITVGSCLAYFITTLPSIESSDSDIFLFFAAALAICAMILPGISGAFILVIIGAYGTVIEAISNRDIKNILIIGAGAIFGILSFSKLLKWLFKSYHQLTLAVLNGFMIGSLNKIWPWKVTMTYQINSKGIEIPINEKNISPFNYDGDPQLLQAFGLMLFGFLIIIFLDNIVNKTNNFDR